MLRRFALITAVAFCVSVLAAAEEKAQTDFTGKVSVDKDDKGKIKTITLTSPDGKKKYNIQPAGKGEQLAKDGDGETAEIKGKLITKKGKKDEPETTWLIISDYKVIFTGTVSVEKDGDTIKSVSIGSLEVKLDSKAKDMANKAEGKEVIAEGSKKKVKTGSGEDAEENEVLTVKSYTIKGEEEKASKDKK